MEQPSIDSIYGNRSFSFFYSFSLFHFQLPTVIVIFLSSLMNGLSLLISAGDPGVGYSTRRSAEETEIQMLASAGDPMLP